MPMLSWLDWTAHVSYEKLKRATLEIRRGAKFIATEP